MRGNRFFMFAILVFLLGGIFAGCCPRFHPLSEAEKGFVVMIDRTAKKLDLNEDQKTKLQGLKAEIRKNFEEGRKENKDSLANIKEEATKENPDIQKMTSLFQAVVRGDAQRIDHAFDLMLAFENNLSDVQKKKLTQMISDWVKKWD